MKQPIPDWLSSKRVIRPSLNSSLSFYYKAFFELCSEREISEVCSSLKWSSIQRYAEYYELEFEQSETFIFLIQKMDNAYVRKSIKHGKSESESDDSSV